MPLKTFAEIPIDIDRSFNFVISNPQNEDVVSSSMVVEGSFELKDDQEMVNRISENSQVHPDFDAYMNDIIRCSKRKISKDENVSVGLDEEYNLTSFQINVFDDSHIEGLKRIKFECLVNNLEEDINFLWFSFHGNILKGSHIPLQYRVVKLNCDVTKPTQKITAEFTPPNHSLMDSVLLGVIYDTVKYIAKKRSDVFAVSGNIYDEFSEFLNPNKTVMYSFVDQLAQCILKRVGGNYIMELTEEELARFEIRLEINSFNGGRKVDKRSLEGLNGILCTSDKYQFIVENEPKEVLVFQEMIPKDYSKGIDKMQTRFVVYYDYEKVGWSNWHEMRVANTRPKSESIKSVKDKEKEKKTQTDSVWKKFWNSIFGTNDVGERKTKEVSLTDELKEIGASIIDGKIILVKAAEILDAKLIEEKKNKIKDPAEADQKFVGKNNQLIEMFVLIWKSMTLGSQNHQLLPEILELNKTTPK